MKKMVNLTLLLAILVMTFALEACNKSNREEGLITGTQETENTANSTEETVITVYTSAFYAYEPNLENMYFKSDLIVIATYNVDICAYVAPFTANIETISTFCVSEVIKGTYSCGDNINVNYRGGRVTLEEYKNARGDGWGVKIFGPELKNYSEEEAKHIYIEEVSLNASISFVNNGQRYMLFLNYNEETSMYVLVSTGYAALMINDDNQVYSPLEKSYIDFPYFGVKYIDEF